MPEYTIQESNVFNNIENYEIEMEVNNNSVGVGSEYDTSNKLTASLKKVIRIIMSGMQNTKFPITYTEQKEIMNEYKNNPIQHLLVSAVEIQKNLHSKIEK